MTAPANMRSRTQAAPLPANGDKSLTAKSAGHAFSLYADPLATWTEQRLLVRDDAWGRYLPFGSSQITARGFLSHSLLVRHYRARSASHILGLHAASAENTCLVGSLDIDQHGNDMIRAEANERAARHWYTLLVRKGFSPLLTASNGNGGFHLRVLLAEPTDATIVFSFLKSLTADHAKIGFDKPPEQFPKQPDVRKCAKGLGNWIRLPGRHHKRDYWSVVWDGISWLAGEEAIAFILALEGDPIALLPRPKPSAKPAKHWHGRPVLTPDRLRSRIERYLVKLPNLSDGQGRDDVAFRFAAFLVRDLAFNDDDALNWLEIWDLGNQPPKGRERLAVIVRNAHLYGQHPIGAGL